MSGLLERDARPPETRLYLDEIVVDSFAGGGGASKGIEMALGRGPDLAFNHDPEAMAIHAANHPDTEHRCEDVWQVDPIEACRGRRVGLMWLSPDCKHFSKAKGGKPVSPRVRGLAWVAVRWAKAVKPRIIVLENVEEFQTWGPVDRVTSRPDPKRKGLTFKRFVGRLRNLGYVIEWRELRACDYGAPTIRKRLFLIARSDGQPIVWPMPTHGPGRPLPWRMAAECIDFSVPCQSIFTREELGLKPLVENTMKRIAAGLRRFVFEADRPFIIPVTHHGDARAHRIDEPMRTITGAHRGEHALVTPHITVFRGGAVGSAIDAPMPTVTANSFIKRPGGCAPLGLVAPLLVEYHGAKRDGDDRAATLERPLPTEDTSNRFGFVAPLLVPRYGEDPDPRRGGGLGQAPRALPVDKPMPTIVPTGNGASLVAGLLAKHYGGHLTPGTPLDRPISTLTTQDHHHLVTAHIAKHYGGRVGSAADEPLHTVTAESVHHALVTSNLLSLRGAGPSHLHGDSAEEPMRTISAGGLHIAEVRAFLIAYNGTLQRTGDLFDPMATLPTHDRFGLVTVDGHEYQLADIGMRMLMARELYRAQGFPDSYRIDIPFTSYYTKKGKLRKKPKTAPMSKTAQVRMCGNSVCPDVAAAIVRANTAVVRTGELVA